MRPLQLMIAICSILTWQKVMTTQRRSMPSSDSLMKRTWRETVTWNSVWFQEANFNHWHLPMKKKQEVGMLLATSRDAVLTAMPNRQRTTIQTRMWKVMQMAIWKTTVCRSSVSQPTSSHAWWLQASLTSWIKAIQRLAASCFMMVSNISVLWIAVRLQQRQPWNRIWNRNVCGSTVPYTMNCVAGRQMDWQRRQLWHKS